MGDWCSGGVECRSGDDAGGERKEELRWGSAGRWGVVIARAVESGWSDSWVVDVAVVGRVDGVDGADGADGVDRVDRVGVGVVVVVVVVWPGGEEGLERAVQKVEVENVESMDVVWAWLAGAGGLDGLVVSSLSNSEEEMLSGSELGAGQEREVNGAAVPGEDGTEDVERGRC